MTKLIGLFLFFLATASLAQSDQEEVSVRDLLKAEDKISEVVESAKAAGEQLDMSTPLSSLILLKEALDANDYETAAEFLDMRYLHKDMEGISAIELLGQLRYVWSRQEILDISMISDHSEGHSNDGLPSHRDEIGRIELGGEEVPIYMQRVPDENGARVWKISNATVTEIPRMWAALGYSPAAKYLRDRLPEFGVLGMENWQTVMLLAGLILSWPAAIIICSLLSKLLVGKPGPFHNALAKFLNFQFRIFIYILLFRFSMNYAGLSLKSTLLLQSSGLMYIAVIVLLLGLINLLQGYQARRLIRGGQQDYVALLKPASSVLKIITIIIVGLVWADDAGFDMSTVLAGLGVGSLAVALAAQKTLENVIGAITIYTAQPIKPGDLCRFGTTVGIVEEIGLRSTMLRTLNRTMVSIPNAVFAADEVENYTQRDRIRYFRYLRLEIAEPAQLTNILEKLRESFAVHKMLQQDTISIRFEEITDNTAHIRVDAGVMTTDFQEYLEVAEGLNLNVVAVVREAGGSFSGPGQQLTVHGGSVMPDALEQFLATQQT